MNKTEILIIIFLCLVIIFSYVFADNIDSTYKYSWGENIGWHNWAPIYNSTEYGVTVYNECLTGYIWQENVGWIKVGDDSCTGGDCCQAGTTKGYENDSNGTDDDGDGVVDDWGVNNDGSGNLSGYAWGENVGWLNFKDTSGNNYNQVTIDSNGDFHNYAWGENIGWVNMNCANTTSCGTVDYKVKTSWSPNTAPTINNVKLNNNTSFSPIENTIKKVDVTGQVVDNDGASDVVSVTALAYRSGVSSTCTTNDNNCYRGITCNTSATGTVIDATCTVSIWFHADPTDAGTYASEYWQGAILATDSASHTTKSSSLDSTVDLNTLYALDVTSSINYGTVNAGNDTGSTNQQTTITTTGNAAIDCSVKGTDMTGGTNGTITAPNQKYALAAFTYSSGGTALPSAGTNAAVELASGKPTTHPSNATDIIYWGLGVPVGTEAASDYSGTNTFTATGD